MHSALHMPKVLVNDMIQAHYIISMQWDREYTDPEDVEHEFLQMMAVK